MPSLPFHFASHRVPPQLNTRAKKGRRKRKKEKKKKVAVAGHSFPLQKATPIPVLRFTVTHASPSLELFPRYFTHHLSALHLQSFKVTTTHTVSPKRYGEPDSFEESL